MTSQHFLLRIYGRVQGVWYRETSRRQAEALGLHGFARNEPDKSVTIEVEGEAAAVDDFVAWCHQGPPLARVERVEQTAGAVHRYIGFEARR